MCLLKMLSILSNGVSRPKATGLHAAVLWRKLRGTCLLRAFDKGVSRLLDVEGAGGGMDGRRGWRR